VPASEPIAQFENVARMDTGNRMSRASRRDYLRRIYPRYQKASGPEKERILDEFYAPPRDSPGDGRFGADRVA